MSEPSNFDFSKFDPSVLDLSHLHLAEQNRIRARQYTSQELALLLRHQNPWTKSGQPDPLPKSLQETREEEPTLEQLLPLMHADTRSTLLYGEMRQSQRDEIIDFYKEQWKEGLKLQRKFPRESDEAPLPAGIKGDEESVKPVHVKYTFIDVVGFSERDPASQAYIVQKLNTLMQSAVKACGVIDRHIFLPTGDGMCIAFLADAFDIHLRVALQLLEIVAEHNHQVAVSDIRKFELRVGLNQGSDIVVRDINGNDNLAGGVINMASRIMALAGAGQIVAGEMVYTDLHEWEQYRDKFVEFSATVKHKKVIRAFQFKSQSQKGLNSSSVVLDVQHPDGTAKSVNKDDSAGISAVEKNRRLGFKAKIKNIELLKLDAPDAESMLWEVLINLWMVNRDEGATAIEDYGLSILLESGEELEGIPIMDSETVVDVSDFRPLSDLFAARDIPLARAHPRTGLIRFRFEIKKTLASASYILRIKDIFGLVYKIKGKLPD